MQMQKLLLDYLDDYMKKNKYSNVQRTTEWYSKRKCYIGGSELNVINESNPYKSKKELVKDKLFNTFKSFEDFPHMTLTPNLLRQLYKSESISKNYYGYDCKTPVPAITPGVFSWNDPTLKKIKKIFPLQWGTTFEAISEIITSIVLCTPVVYPNAWIDGEPKGFKYHSNSPDGYGIIKSVLKNGHEEIITNECLLYSIKEVKPHFYSLMSLEFKAPCYRVSNGKVPKYYLPQVYSSIELSQPYVDRGMFIDMYYRICSLEHLDFGCCYNTQFHFLDKKKNCEFEIAPKCIGVMHLYTTKELYTNYHRMKQIIANNIEADFEDFGKAPISYIYLLFNEIVAKRISVKYDVFMMGTEINIQQPDEEYYIGVLPWKLFQMDMYIINRNQDFMESMKQPIIEFMENLLHPHLENHQI